jgi:hypothetical protein
MPKPIPDTPPVIRAVLPVNFIKVSPRFLS